MIEAVSDPDAYKAKIENLVKSEMTAGEKTIIKSISDLVIRAAEYVRAVIKTGELMFPSRTADLLTMINYATIR